MAREYGTQYATVSLFERVPPRIVVHQLPHAHAPPFLWCATVRVMARHVSPGVDAQHLGVAAPVPVGHVQGSPDVRLRRAARRVLPARRPGHRLLRRRVVVFRLHRRSGRLHDVRDRAPRAHPPGAPPNAHPISECPPMHRMCRPWVVAGSTSHDAHARARAHARAVWACMLAAWSPRHTPPDVAQARIPPDSILLYVFLFHQSILLSLFRTDVAQARLAVARRPRTRRAADEHLPGALPHLLPMWCRVT